MASHLWLQDIVLYIVLALGILVYGNAIVIDEENPSVKQRIKRHFRLRMWLFLTLMFGFGILYQSGFLGKITSAFAIGAMGLVMLLMVWLKKRNTKLLSKEE
jgi:hypothetical protein